MKNEKKFFVPITHSYINLKWSKNKREWKQKG